MLLHHCDLFLQFLRIHPEVIACAIGNVFAFASQQTVDIVVSHPFVLWVTEESDLRIALGIVLTDGTGIVGGGILTNHDLYRQMTPLTQDGIQRTSDGLLLIIGDDDDRDHLFHLSLALKKG